MGPRRKFSNEFKLDAVLRELLSNGAFKTRKEAKIKVFEYIELYYNKKRIHSSLNWCTKEEYLENYYKNSNKEKENAQQREQKEAV